MELLPPAQEREHLLDELADVILAAGVEPFLAAPILMPDDATFPDPWDGGALGVYRLLRRIQTYAGLGELALHLVLDDFSDRVAGFDHHGRQLDGHEGVAGWFAGIENNQCYFGIDLAQLSTPDILAGTLAHEVCHAYRHWLGITTPDRLPEELRTDLTSIYLGFGILTANASLQFRSGQLDARTSFWRRQQGGYLSPQSLCYLLAAQAVARGLSADERKAIARRLETNQAACFRAACDTFERDDLLARLGLPAPALHPRVRGLPDVAFDRATVRALSARAASHHDASGTRASDVAIDAPSRPSEVVLDARGRRTGPVDDEPTFRITRRVPRRVSWLVGGLVALAIAVPVAVVDLGVAIACALLVPAIVRVAWPRRPFDACAYASCRATIPADALRCPGCRRPVGGHVESEAARLDAAEEWHAKRRRRRAANG